MLELQFLEHKKVEMLLNYSNFIVKIRENRATVVIKKSKYVVSKSNNGNVKWIVVKYLGLISNFLEIELDIIERMFYNGDYKVEL